MSSIALFHAIFTEEEEIRDQIAAASGYKIIQDTDIVNEVCQKYDVGKEKVERALQGPTSIFNKFTHERQRITAYMKLIVAEKCNEPGIIWSGYITQLIPSAITHVLKVGLFDEKGKRIQRAITIGLNEKGALKSIKKNDTSQNEWTDFLFQLTASDSSLYDIVIPVGKHNTESVVQLIMENYNKPAVLMNEESRLAVDDMIIVGKVELALLDKGYVTEVESSKGEVTLCVNKSVHNFSKLTEILTIITKEVSGVKGVIVSKGKDYFVSVYRDEEFVLPPKVLLVDDEKEFVQTLSDRLNTRNYGSCPVFDGEEALSIIGNETPDVMVLDLKMPNLSGVDVLRKTKEKKPEVEIIILTGHGSEEDKKICMALGAYAYLQKPIDIKELAVVIDKAYKKVAAAKVAHL